MLVGLPTPLQPSRVDDEHVDVALANSLFPGGDVVVAMYLDRFADCLALVADRPRQLLGDVAGQPDIERASAAVEQRRHDDHGEDDEQHDDERCPERTRSAPLAHLPDRHQPTLLQVAHAVTACRNSSESDGGW